MMKYIRTLYETLYYIIRTLYLTEIISPRVQYRRNYAAICYVYVRSMMKYIRTLYGAVFMLQADIGYRGQNAELRKFRNLVKPDRDSIRIQIWLNFTRFW